MWWISININAKNSTSDTQIIFAEYNVKYTQDGSRARYTRYSG